MKAQILLLCGRGLGSYFCLVFVCVWEVKMREGETIDHCN